MKTIKPEKLGILHRVFENDQRPYLALCVFVGSRFRSPKTLVSEIGVWKAAAEELAGDGGILDEGFPKPSGEVLVSGRCFAPQGKPVPATTARLHMGSVDKRVAVFGDRVWKNGESSPPKPFTEMPIDWAHAFGGATHPPNIVGMGAAPLVEEDGSTRHPLPNVEKVGKLIVDVKDRPPPEGFGSLDLSRPQRVARAGSYDRTWLETRSPGLPVDFDVNFFHTAPPDQWIEGFFRGGESFIVENMHPTEAKLEGKLPEIVVRAFVVMDRDVPPGPKVGAGQTRAVPREAFRELPLRVDTVRLFPNQELSILFYRGVLEIAEDDADDVLHLLIAAEDPTAPRDVDHYHHVLEMRLDPEKYPWALTRDSDLMPPVALGWDAAPDRGDITDLVGQENLLRKNMERGADAHLERKRPELEQKGLWVPQPKRDDDELDIEQAMKKFEALRREGEEKRVESQARAIALEARAREAFQKQGIDYDKEVAKAKKDAAGPPKWKAKPFLKQMRELAHAAREAGSPMPDIEASLADPAWEAELEGQEQRLLASYRSNAHRQEAVDGATPSQSELIRAELSAAKEHGAPVVGRDFTGADLSNLDLSGIDLTHSLLESADLTGTILRDAKLRGTVLAHARLVGTVLAGADLTGANLGGATLEGTDLTGAVLDNTLLGKAHLERVVLAGARLTRTQLLEATFGAGVDFGSCVASQLLFYKIDLRGCSFASAAMEKSNFLECDLTGCNMKGADLRGCGFLKSSLKGVDLQGARLEQAQLTLETTLEGANLTGAMGRRTNFRSTIMRQVKLTSAVMPECDFSKADLTQADLRGAVLRNALMTRTDFTEARLGGCDALGALMSKAILVGTDLRGANLFATDMTRVRVDGRTKIDKADLRRARVHPKRKEGGAFGGPR